MTEHFVTTPEMPCDPLLGKIDDTVESNPKLKVDMSNGIAFKFSVGYCEAYGAAKTPRQVLMATTEGNALISLVSVNPEENTQYVVQREGGQKQPFGSDEANFLDEQDLVELDGLMDATDFNQEAAVNGALRARLGETVAAHRHWMPMMTDARPLLDLA